MEYPKCSNGSCVYNDEYFCKAGGLGEDIVCKQGKADAVRRVRNQQESLYHQIRVFNKKSATYFKFQNF